MKKISDELYEKLDRLGLVPCSSRTYNIGTSDYSDHLIQPWSIWIEYNLDGFDADIIKRVLRTKAGTSRVEDYRKIMHICQEKLRILAHDPDLIVESKINKDYEDKE